MCQFEGIANISQSWMECVGVWQEVIFYMNIWKVRWYVFGGLPLKYIHVRPVSSIAWDVWWIMDKVLIINFWSGVKSGEICSVILIKFIWSVYFEPSIARENIKNKSNHMLNSVVSSVPTFSLTLLRTYISNRFFFNLSWKYPVSGNCGYYTPAKWSCWEGILVSLLQSVCPSVRPSIPHPVSAL